MSKATWDRQRLAAACLMLLVVAALGTIRFSAAAPSSAATATTTYDTAAYTYDASSSLSTQDVVTPSPRGSPATLPAASQEDSVSLGRFGDAAETGAGAETLVGQSSTYVDLTRVGSIRNVGTNATNTEFAETLTQNGWASQVSRDGAVQIFEQDGARYVLRQQAGSYSGWSADFTPAGSARATLKLRLGFE